MTYVIADRVKQKTTTAGTSTIVLGASVTGFQYFANACANGDTFHYAMVHLTDGNWETGLGTYWSGNTSVSRTALTSSNSNSLVDFAVGDKEIFITPISSNIVLKSNVGGVNIVRAATLDFGNTANFGNTFYVLDSAALTTSRITVTANASTANSAYGGDELEMDGLTLSAVCNTNGNITVQAVPNPGPIWGKRNINYIVGSGTL